MRPGSNFRDTSPAIIPPDPRPDTRDAHAARRPAPAAARPRTDNAVGEDVDAVAPGAVVEEAGPFCARELMR
ncbi:hypothetical protein NCCP2495_17350 [Dietzia sp. NCCP-2495]|nr:hypothetical protein NCCP2495_17350 [Dietzia sp. NCCP-2495]